MRGFRLHFFDTLPLESFLELVDPVVVHRFGVVQRVFNRPTLGFLAGVQLTSVL